MSNNSYTPSTFAHASLYKTNPSIPCCSMNTPGTQSGNNERLPVAPTATSRPRRPSLMRLRTLSEADHSPGWQSWIDRNNFAFFIFGLLVSTHSYSPSYSHSIALTRAHPVHSCRPLLTALKVPLPVATVLSASRLMFPGYTGISGIILAVPAAIVSFALPMLATRISYNIILLLNVLLGILALLFSTLGSGIAGPIIGTALAGISSALGQYLYLGVAASYDQRVVITFSLGTRKLQYTPLPLRPNANLMMHRIHFCYQRRHLRWPDDITSPRLEMDASSCDAISCNPSCHLEFYALSRPSPGSGENEETHR